ncbi:hypothetical protein [Chitinophaga sp. MM2321]|uniref:hypothetical protein n=1 Tax=Chitinophaga sp. MM2321 TaxID=3137178 RepID=UPI0032D5A592
MIINRALIAGAGLITGLLMQINVHAQDSEPNKWAPANISIDGQATEWPKPLQFYNNETKLFYTIANDKDTLYVIVSVPDPQSQFKIMRSGLTFSINPSGKKKVGASLTFPLTTNATPAPDVPEESQQRVAEEWKKKILANVKEIKVDGFTGIDNGKIPVANKYGIRTASSFDAAGNLICEMAIPLSVAGIPAGSDKPVAYRFKVNALNKEDRKPRDPKAGQQDPNAAQGQGGANDPRMMSLMYFSTDFWTKQTLATH